MIVERPVPHPMTEPALAEIQAEGVTITPQIVLWVDNAAKQIRSAPLRGTDCLVDWPVTCGGAVLYPLTFGAAAWLMRLPARMRDDARVIGWAMAQYKRPEAFDGLSVLAASAAVMRWALRLTCSYAALAAVVDELLGSERYVEIKDGIERKRDAQSWQWGAAVRALCTKYPGTTGAYWTWQVSRRYALEMLQAINSELPAGQQISDYEIEANAAFRAIVEHIKAGEPDTCGECGRMVEAHNG